MILFTLTLLLAFPINSGHALPGPRQKQQQPPPQRTGATSIQSTKTSRETSSTAPEDLTNNVTSSSSWFFRVPVPREMFNATTISKSSSLSLSSPTKVDSTFRSLTRKRQELPSPSVMKERIICFAMAISGIVESVCLHKFGCFPNLMTGITVKSLDGLAGGEWEAARFGLSMVVMYILGGTCYQNIVQHASRRRPPPSQTPYITRKVAWMSAFCFIISDLLRHQRAFQLPLLSLGFGAINAFGTTVWGGVTNAVTGHWTKIGLGLSEQIFHQVWSRLSNQDSSDRKHMAAGRASAKAIASFALSLLTTSFVMRRIDHLPAILQTFLSNMPPFGTCLALIYTLLLTRYANYHEAWETEQRIGYSKRIQ